MQVVGVSADTPADNQAWATAQGFPFELWSDTNTTLALHYGAAASAGQSWFDRQTELLDAEGVLILEYDPVLNYTTHPQLVLEDCQVIFGR